MLLQPSTLRISISAGLLGTQEQCNNVRPCIVNDACMNLCIYAHFVIPRNIQYKQINFSVHI